MSTSYWLYMHPELGGQPNFWKVGKSLTPHSAVRSRQRFLVNDFYLTAVWFGEPGEIADLERDIHDLWRPQYPNKLGSSRGELIYYDAHAQPYTLECAIELMIHGRQSNITRMHTGDARGYHATNASQCCFRSDQERHAHDWSAMKLKDMFNIQSRSPGRWQDLLDRYGARYYHAPAE